VARITPCDDMRETLLDNPWAAASNERREPLARRQSDEKHSATRTLRYAQRFHGRVCRLKNPGRIRGDRRRWADELMLPELPTYDIVALAAEDGDAKGYKTEEKSSLVQRSLGALQWGSGLEAEAIRESFF